MALILKSGKTYTDKTSASGSSTCYGKIKETNNDTVNSVFTIELCIYKNEASRDALASPLEAYRYVCSGDDYATYFGVDVLDGAGVNEIKQGYSFILNEVKSESTTDEEGNIVEGELAYIDWESDEA
ncbi:conserved hypothetical protein [uncultured Thiomicrorhabdus sp.]